MKIVKILVLGLFITSFVYADFDEAPAGALEWWLRNQNKFEGAKVSTRELPNGKFKITEWVITGVPEPTNAEVKQMIIDYKAYLAQAEIDKKLNKASAKLKLKNSGFTDGEIELIVK